MTRAALVLFSGGQDSSTCLAWALETFDYVETIGFNYGQRHAVEMNCREDILRELGKINDLWASRLGEDHILDAGVIGQISETSLTREIRVHMTEEGLPNTFVPGRNILFLTLAAALAFRRGIRHIVTGVCETDYSGYPDCRDDTIKSLQVSLNLGMQRRFIIETPLMWVDKAQTWKLAAELGGSRLVDLLREKSHTCYLGDRTHRHTWGYGCGQCPSCDLRANGWVQYQASEAQTNPRIASD